MRKLVFSGLLVSVVLSGICQQKDDNEVTEVRKVLNTFMDCLIHKDSARFYSLFQDGPVAWVGVYKPKTERQTLEKDSTAKTVFNGDYRRFYRGILRDAATEEKFTNIVIQSDDRVASVIFDYSFWLDGKMTNWGKESWSLVKISGKWKISSVIFSIELQPDDKQATGKKPKVLFYLQDGVEILDFAGPMEVFSAAGLDVATVSRTKAPIKAQGILTILPDYSIEDAPHADILAFFGGYASKAANDTSVIRWLNSQTKPEYYFSVCSGAFILAKAGLLDNLIVTTFHESIERLRKEVPTATVLANTRYVDNGEVITTAGVSAGIDGALHLVTRLQGEEAAAKVAKYMEYDKWIPNQGLVIKKENKR